MHLHFVKKGLEQCFHLSPGPANHDRGHSTRSFGIEIDVDLIASSENDYVPRFILKPAIPASDVHHFTRMLGLYCLTMGASAVRSFSLKAVYHCSLYAFVGDIQRSTAKN